MATEVAEVPADTADFLLEYVRDAPERQLSAADAVHATLVQVFAAASVVVGLVALADFSPWYIVGAGAAYAGVALSTVIGLWSRNFQTTRYPDVLWSQYYMDSPAAIKLELVAKIADVYPKNREILKFKHWALVGALTSLAVEVGFIVVAVIGSAA